MKDETRNRAASSQNTVLRLLLKLKKSVTLLRKGKLATV